MRDVRAYWREVREIAASLPADVWVTSVNGGRVVEVPALRAAELLVAKSHRVATEEEVAGMRAEEERWNRRVAEAELKRSGVAVVALKKAG